MIPRIIQRTTKCPEQHARPSSFRGVMDESLAEPCGKVDLFGSRMGKWLGAPFSAITILGFPRIIIDP